MNNIGKKFEIFVVVAIIALIGIVYAFKQKPVLAPTTNNQNTAQNENNNSTPSDQNDQSRRDDTSVGTPTGTSAQVPSNVISYKGQDGKNALELLQATHRVDVKHYSFGDLVTGIDGITPDAQHFWAMYVNGQFSQVGASAYATKSSDTIKWQIDTVTSN